MSLTVNIDGLVVTPLREIADERGAVLHMLRADAPEFRGFAECYFSEIKPGVTKGWKRHRRQTQILTVPAGRVRFVIHDTRESSRTKGRVDLIEIGRPDAYARLCIPPLLWYAFTCVGDKPALVANCTDVPHDPSEGEVIDLDALPDGCAAALRHGGGPNH
jgi:dTDP-4-dehydrorhamnose 3,5-epimerase